MQLGLEVQIIVNCTNPSFISGGRNSVQLLLLTSTFIFNLALVVGGLLVNSPTAQSLDRCMQVFFCDRIYFHQQFFIQHLLEVRRQFPERFFASKKAKKNLQYNIGFAAMLAAGKPISNFFTAVLLSGQDKHLQTFVC